MHPINRLRRRTLAALALTAGILGGSTAVAQQPTPPAAGGQAPVVLPAKVDTKTGVIFVPINGIARYSTGTNKPIKSIAFTKDRVVEHRLIPEKQDAVDLIGKAAGLTEMVITFADNSTMSVTLVSQVDYDLLKNIIKRSFPTASVDVIPVQNDVIILTGYVNHPDDSALIEKIAQQMAGLAQVNYVGAGSGNAVATGGGSVINTIRVGGSQHVMIDVVVASVDRSELRNRGFSFIINGSQGNFGSFLGGLINPVAGAQGGTNANILFGIAPAGINGALLALRTENLAKVLVEPKVVTQTGREAYIQSGGEQAIISGQSGITGPGVTYRPVGTILSVLPIVQGDGKILLEVTPSFTVVNNGLGLQVPGGGFSPGFSTQTARSVVSLESGQTFAIGGLIQNTVQSTSTKVPLLGDLPFVGTAFSTANNEERESELIILVTPRLVEPMDCAQVPRRVPGRETRNVDDHEFYLEGLLEAPRGQRQVWNGLLRYNPAWKCDTTNRFPCVGDVCGGGASRLLLHGHGKATCDTGGCATPAPAAAPTVKTSAPATLPLMPAPETSTEAPVAPLAPAIEPPVLAPATPGQTPAPVPVIEGPKQ